MVWYGRRQGSNESVRPSGRSPKNTRKTFEEVQVNDFPNDFPRDQEGDAMIATQQTSTVAVPEVPVPLVKGEALGRGRRRRLVRPALTSVRRVVIKVGTRVVTDARGRLARRRLRRMVEVLAQMRHEGREVLLVSSGAVRLGSTMLGFETPPLVDRLRRVCAAVGQTRLVALYQEELARHGLICGQVLLTQGDFDDRPRYLELRRTLNNLLATGAVPILNENDAVVRERPPLAEARPIFSDNDRLSALIASKLEAELLVLLTDVEGVYDRPPKEGGSLRLSRIDTPDCLGEVRGEAGDGVGRGGMASKVEAAWIAARGGCHAVIASGHRVGVLEQVLAGRDIGSWFPARNSLPARRRWIAYAASPRGVLHLDAGAVEAMCQRGASLLPVGVVRAEGDFKTGEVVELRGPEGARVGRGIVLYDAATVRRWLAGERPTDLRHPNTLVRRTHMVFEGQ